jgi:hypothetical protein
MFIVPVSTRLVDARWPVSVSGGHTVYRYWPGAAEPTAHCQAYFWIIQTGGCWRKPGVCFSPFLPFPFLSPFFLIPSLPTFPSYSLHLLPFSFPSLPLFDPAFWGCATKTGGVGGCRNNTAHYKGYVSSNGKNQDVVDFLLLGVQPWNSLLHPHRREFVQFHRCSHG